MANTLLGFFRASSGEDPLTDLKALEAWFETLPRNDYLAASEAMVRALEEMGARQPRLGAGRVLAVLELDRVSSAIQGRLLKQYLLPTLSDQVRQRLWHALDDLARWFAYTYETLFEAMLGGRAPGQMHAIVSRMFHYRGLQARNGLFRYEKWIPGRWKGLHAAYGAALDKGVARTPFRFAQDTESASSTAEQEYALILLLQRINTGNLDPWQIERAAQWLRKWGMTLRLADPPAKGDGFWLDLGLGDGLLIRRPQSVQGRLLYLEVGALQREIGDALVELALRVQRVPQEKNGEAGERLALLPKLQALWRPELKLTPRRGVRVQSDRPVHVAPGLIEITASLRGSNPDDSLDRRFRRGDPIEAAAGNVETAGVAEPTGIDYQNRAAGAWRMQDASESGLKLVSQSAEAGQQKLGSMLGVLDEGHTRWRVGIVRRLKKFSGGLTELGIEVIAPHCLLISPKPLASRKTGYSVDGIDVSLESKSFDALYLPPANTPGRVAFRSMVVPAQEFGEKRRLFMTFDSAAYTIEFSTPIERTKDWVWTTFDVIREAA